jgi:hypothetical protein
MERDTACPQHPTHVPMENRGIRYVFREHPGEHEIISRNLRQRHADIGDDGIELVRRLVQLGTRVIQDRVFDPERSRLQRRQQWPSSTADIAYTPNIRSGAKVLDGLGKLTPRKVRGLEGDIHGAAR